MRRYGLIFPGGRENAMKAAARAARYLQEHDCAIAVEDAFEQSIEGAHRFPETGVDALISLGGDGTMLRCVPYALRYGAPILGVNLGQKGFLTGCEATEMEQALGMLLQDALSGEERTLLEVHDGEQTWYGLNDCAILRMNSPRMCQTRLFIDGQLACTSMADGVILASATGSTGYALSAGGPLVMPAVRCMVFSAICPHALQYRPIVMPSDSRVVIELFDDPEMCLTLQVDGRSRCMLRAGERLEITSGKKPVRLLHFEPLSFFDAVEKKLIRWSEG